MNKITEKSKKKWVGYVIFGILLTLVLLYYRFPSEAIQGFLQARVEKINPQLALSMEKVSPSYLRFEIYGTGTPPEDNPSETYF